MQGKELKAIRKSLGITGEQMARAMGLTRTSIVRMELGQQPIEARTELAALYLRDNPDDALRRAMREDEA